MTETAPRRRFRRTRRIARWALAILPAGFTLGVLTLVTLDAIFPFPIERLEHRPLSPVVLDRDGRILFSRTATDDQWRIPAKLDHIAPSAIDATIAAEDQRYYTHPGVDAIAIARAIGQNLRELRIVSGASTITMQVCDMMEGGERSWSGKCVEAFRAMQLERIRSKERILEDYLTEAPYGGNLRGIEMAARHYFGRPASLLTLSESALLAGLPQSPERYRPDRHPVAARERRNLVLQYMFDLGYIDQEAMMSALVEPIHLYDGPTRGGVSHVAMAALARRPEGGATTIDGTLQASLTAIVREAAKTLPAEAHVAVVAIDVATADILAWIGSSDFQRTKDGQNDGVLAWRSPGSALKPFVYAAAFEAKRLAPDSIVPDVRIERAGWAPENFDGVRHGEVSVADALRRSLNVPAILTAERMGVDRCAGVIQSVGVKLADGAADRARLSLATGGADVRLLDLTNAYATLARGGLRRTPRLFSDADSEETRVLNVDTCRALDTILNSHARSPAGMEETPAERRPWFMWKTGTSSARRDAWAVGHNHRIAVGVWVGRFDGAPATQFVGRAAAEPILAKVFTLPQVATATPAEAFVAWDVARPLFSDADAGTAETAPRIASPENGATFVATGDQAIVHATTEAEVSVAWFLDGEFVERTASLRIDATPGRHELACVADSGATRRVAFRVVRK
ncbi:MAG TPA: penicillin-binding protein 1C [Phycisphaerae bacterium]|nr:penicillin-binding protein 1C [Phycisphaerae bacterium]HRW54420.1 penicillin-binding protein 1C [Phycisphaerae bacterium]